MAVPCISGTSHLAGLEHGGPAALTRTLADRAEATAGDGVPDADATGEGGAIPLTR